jgi:prepilin-type N-terminal cleavage/methylation domain-containing protein
MLVCRPKSAGFSLMELAIVLSIIALVGGMSMSIGKTMLDVTEINGTRERLETLRAALLLFQKKQGSE